MSNQIKNKGTTAELFAMAALSYNRYEVFNNVSPNGNTDIIAVKNNISYRIQVKSFFQDRKQIVAETRSTSSGPDRYKHYSLFVDKMAFVDINSGEVFLTNVPSQRCKISKSKLLNFKIFPMGGSSIS